MPRYMKDWIPIATFSDKELLDKFISGKFVSVLHKYTHKSCDKIVYACRSKKQFGCPYEMTVVIPGDSDKFIVSETGQHVHTEYRKKSLSVNLRKIVDPLVEAGMSMKEIRRVLLEQHFPLPDYGVLYGYIGRKRRKLSRPADDLIPSSSSPSLSNLWSSFQTDFESDDNLESSKLFFLVVTCGSLKGRLILDKFFCPAIHVPCIQIGAHVMLTPKQFSVEAGCEKNSQWELVILHENQSLKETMDSGGLEFFDHANRCSGLCDSPMVQVKEALQREKAKKAARISRKKIVAEKLEVTCNGLKGTLIMSEFICPGLHEKCIVCEDGELTTPKDFVFKGTKSDKMMYKDEKTNEWRRMIMYEGVPLSRYMGRKGLDFFNHAKFCTQYCKRKPHRKTEGISESSASECESDENISSEESRELDPEDQDSLPSISDAVRNSMEQDIVPTNDFSAAIEIEDNKSSVQENLAIFKDPANFWKRITELGLIDEIFKDMSTQCKILFNPEIESKPQVSLEFCRYLSSTVQTLGLTSNIMNKFSEQQDKFPNFEQKLEEEEAETLNPEDQKVLKSEIVLAEQWSSCNSTHSVFDSYNYSGPPLKQPKMENLTEMSLSLFDSC